MCVESFKAELRFSFFLLSLYKYKTIIMGFLTGLFLGTVIGIVATLVFPALYKKLFG